MPALLLCRCRSWRVCSVGALAFLFVLLPSTVHAKLDTVIADDGTNRIVLKNIHEHFYQNAYLAGLVTDHGQVAPYWAPVDCKTFGSQNIEKARAKPEGMSFYVARYNLVNLWMGAMCEGKSDVLPTAAEAQAWIKDMAGLRHGGDNAPFLDSHEKLMELYLFGGPGVPPDYTSALAYLNEEVKTRPGRAALYLAYVYEHGLGVPKDEVQARAWFQQAADAGNGYAQMLLVQAQELGLGMPRNEAQAFESYLKMSKTVWPPVWFRLGLMYLDGRGTAKDACAAKEWLAKAAERPIPQAKPFLERIERENLCPAKERPAPTQVR